MFFIKTVKNRTFSRIFTTMLTALVVCFTTTNVFAVCLTMQAYNITTGQTCPAGYGFSIRALENGYSSSVIGSCNPCSLGYYKSSAGNTSCTPCDSGTTSCTGSDSSTDCTPSGSGGTTPTLQTCNPGQYKIVSVLHPSSYFCAYCPEGTYSELYSVTSCTPCSADTYADGTGNTGCSPCATHASSGTGAAYCTCDSGYSISGSSYSTSDPSGSSCTQTITSCGAGQYLSGGSCVGVGDGYYSPNGSTTRYACSSLGGGLFTHSDGTRGSNTDCYMTTSSGKYLALSNNSAETSCEDGYYCPGSVKVYYNSAPGGRYACSNVGGGLFTHSDGTRSSATNCYMTTTSGQYLASSSNTSLSNCTSGSYCPGNVKVYYTWAPGESIKSCATNAKSDNGASYCVCRTGFSIGGGTSMTNYSTSDPSGSTCAGKTYNISYSLNGGSYGSSHPTSTTVGTTITINNPTRSGYTFTGWTITGMDGGTHYIGSSTNTNTSISSTKETSFKNLCHSDTSTCTVTFTANWTGISSTISFNANGGSGGQTADVTATYGSALPSISTTKPTKSGYAFAGWWDAQTGGTKYYNRDGSDAKAPWDKTSNTTLYAHWVQTYEIKLMKNDGTIIVMGTLYAVKRDTELGTFGVFYDSAATNQAWLTNITEHGHSLPTRSGYTFAGYYDTSASSGGTIQIRSNGYIYNAGYAPGELDDTAGNATGPFNIYARWTQNTIHCDPGWFLPAGQTECAKCKRSDNYYYTNNMSADYWCEGGNFTVSATDNQGLVQCPDIVDNTGAATFAHQQATLTDSDKNQIQDKITDCVATFKYTKFGDFISNPASTYNANSTLNTGIAQSEYYCFYNTNSGHYDRCYYPTAVQPTICAGGYKVKQSVLDTFESMKIDGAVDASLLVDNIGSPINPCEIGEANHYTNLYDILIISNEEAVRNLADKYSMIIIDGVIFNSNTGDQVNDISEVYKLCPPTEYPLSSPGSYSVTQCYATVTFKDGNTILKTENHEFSGSSDGTNITTNPYHISNYTPTKSGFVFDGWYENSNFSGNKITTSTDLSDNKILFAKWRVENCGAGEYKNDNVCTMCPEGYRESTGGTNDTPNNINECRRSCTTDNIGNSTSVTGNDYYGGLENDTCSAVSCATHYHTYTNPDLMTQIGISEAGNGYGYVSHDGENIYNASTYGLSATNDRGKFVVNYGNKGTIKGHGRCSARNSSSTTWDTGDYILGPDGTTWTFPDNSGAFCYCHLDSYTSSGSNIATTLVEPWIFEDGNGLAANCEQDCTYYCAGHMYYDGASTSIDSQKSFRETMFAALNYPRSVCAPDVYTVSFNTNGGNAIDPVNYTYGSAAIKLPEPSKENNAFKGWYSDSNLQNFVGDADDEYTPTAPITLYAKWAVPIIIPYDSDGGSSVPDGLCYYGEDLTLPAAPTKEHYTFAYWVLEHWGVHAGETVENGCTESYLGVTSGTADSATAVWTRQMTIHFDANAGGQETNNIPTDKQCTYYSSHNRIDCSVSYTVKSDVASGKPSRTGYNIVSWNTRADGSGTNFAYNKNGIRPGGRIAYVADLNDIYDETFDDEITLYAQWELETYNIEYYDGDELYDEYTYTYSINNQTIVPDEPTKEHYAFLGWCENDDTCDDPQKTITIDGETTGDLTYYAKWVVPITIPYDSAGGSSVPDGLCYYGEDLTLPAAPTKEHYEFDSWRVSIYGEPAGTTLENGCVEKYLGVTSGTANTVTAIWTRQMTIHFDANAGGQETTNIPTDKQCTYTSGSGRIDCSVSYTVKSGVASGKPSRTGYNIVSWNTRADGSGTNFAYNNSGFRPGGGTAYTADLNDIYDETFDDEITLYAQWEAQTYNIEYYDDDELYDEYTYTYSINNQTIVPDEPTKEHYVFVGWCDNEELTGDCPKRPVITGGTTGDLTYYAKWARQITIHFDANTNEETLNIPSDMVCVEDEICKVSYTVTSRPHGLPPSTNRPLRTGYSFENWNTDIYGSRESFVYQVSGHANTTTGYAADLSGVFDLTDGYEITLYAQWGPRTYNIIYHSDGTALDNITPDSFVYSDDDNQTFTPTPSPTKTGYIFSGWCEDSTLNGSCPSTITIPAGTYRDVDYYAKWTPITYSIAFNGNKADGYKNNVVCTYDTACDISNNNNFTYEGYIFGGWDTNKNTLNPTYPQTDAGIEVLNLSSTNNDTVLLYAIWKEHRIDIQYIYNDLQGNTENGSCKFNNTFTPVPPAPESKPGWRFVGWRVQ